MKIGGVGGGGEGECIFVSCILANQVFDYVSHNKFTGACKPIDTLRRWQTVNSRTRIFDVRKPGGGGGWDSLICAQGCWTRGPNYSTSTSTSFSSS
jgi:hypothetical protein